MRLARGSGMRKKWETSQEMHRRDSNEEKDEKTHLDTLPRHDLLSNLSGTT